MSELSVDIVAWIEGVIDEKIVHVKRQGRYRPQFFINAVTGEGKTLDLFLRMPRNDIGNGSWPAEFQGDGSVRPFSPAHESVVLQALQNHGVAVPAVLDGYHESTESILMEWVAGTQDLTTLTSPEELDIVMGEFFENLARLHKLTPSDLAITHLDIPKTASRDRPGRTRARSLRARL